VIDLAVLVLALAFDLALGEPPAAVHPVVWMGGLVGALERRAPKGPRAQLIYGGAMVAVGVLTVALAAWLLFGFLRVQAPLAYAIVGALALKSSFAVRCLFQAAEAVRRPLAVGRVDEARLALRSLVSRDTSRLDPPLLSAAAVESVAENSGDSFVAPLFYFAIFGPPGALAYRMLNTFDSMVGYHGKYEHLGKAAARLDDLANLVPARLAGLLLVLASAAAGAGLVPAWRTMWRYHAATESPNAGWPMSAMAGALGVRLEKVGHYRLGDGGAVPDAATVTRGQRVAALALALATLLFALVLVVKDVYLA